MTYVQIIDKIKMVFESCVLYSQVEMAYNYCSRLNAKYNFSWQYGESIDYGLIERYIDRQRELVYERFSNIETKG